MKIICKAVTALLRHHLLVALLKEGFPVSNCKTVCDASMDEVDGVVGKRPRVFAAVMNLKLSRTSKGWPGVDGGLRT
jgi:hypothetical protein